MRKKILPVLLALAMVLGMLPMSVFAEEAAGPEIAGYGFLWNEPTSETTLAANGKVGNDWMKETMYVVFKENVPANTNLWFQIKVGNDVWGCAAQGTGNSNTYAFSFLNRGTQWEQHPTIAGETFDYSGKNVTHATSYMKAGSVTLEYFVTESLIETEQTSTPDAVTNGTAAWSKTLSITANVDVKEEVEAEEEPTSGLALKFETLTAEALSSSEGKIFGMAPANLGTFDVTANGTAVTVTGAANHVKWEEFNTNTADDEQEGHYLPIRIFVADADQATAKGQTITVTGSKAKELTFGDDGSFELAMFLDHLTNKQFTVKLGDTVYTVDCTGVALNKLGAISAPVEENTVKPSEDVVNDAVTSQVDDSSAEKVSISVAAPEDSETKKVNVPLSTTALAKLENVEKPLVIETPQGGVSADAKTLIEKTGKDDAVSFVMENTTAPSATDTQTFSVGFFKDTTEIEVKDLTADKAITLTFKTSFAQGKSVTVTSGTTSIKATVGTEGAVTITTTHLSNWTIKLDEATKPPVVNPPVDPITDKAPLVKYTDRKDYTSAADKQTFFGGKLEIKNPNTVTKTYIVSLGDESIKVGDMALSITYVVKVNAGATYAMPCQNMFNVKIIEIPAGTDVTEDLTVEDDALKLDWTPVADCKDSLV